MENFKNGFTRELDCHRINKDPEIVQLFATYLMEPNKPFEKEGVLYIPIREPGHTVGGIVLHNEDPTKIKEIVIYTNIYSPYKKTVQDYIKQFKDKPLTEVYKMVVKKYETTFTLNIGEAKIPIYLVEKDIGFGDILYDLECKHEIPAMAWYTVYEESVKALGEGKLKEVKIDGKK